MKTKLILFSIVCLVLFISCNNKSSYQPQMSMALQEKNLFAPPPPPPLITGEYAPKLIKKGELTISSSDIESTKILIFRFVGECQGYVVSENLVKNEPTSYYQLSLNIEASYFEKFNQLLDSSKLNIVSKSFSVADVSMQYIDDSTRLANKKILEKRYLDLLGKTNDIKDILEVEEKLENIRTEIEVKETQMKMLNKQIAYSSISMVIEKNTSNLTYEETNKYSHKLAQGIIEGWDGAKALIVFLISIWPFYLLFALIYFMIKLIIKKRKPLLIPEKK